MLLQLPKDILRYILSLVVYDTLVEKYGMSSVGCITSSFAIACRYDESEMSTAVKTLSLIHPSTRQLLVDVSEVNLRIRYWRFKPSFFVTLLQNN